MGYDVRIRFLLVIICSTVFAASEIIDLSQENTRSGADKCFPTVIAHRGASGYVPEHTLGSYALAITMGADYVEPDLVMTKDGQLVARHDSELSETTDVSQIPEFAHRKRTQTVDDEEITGWFTEDFTLAEIKTLRSKERIPNTRPGNARINGTFSIPTFQEIIDLVKSLQFSQHRQIGLYPEIKHSTHFKRLGLPMEQLVVDTFHRNGYTGSKAPVYIQSFEVNNLKELKNLTELRLLQLLDDKWKQPYDQVVSGTGLNYGEMATPAGLKEVAKYAAAVSPDKGYIIPRDSENRLGTPTNFVTDAHMVGLKVHPFTFRAENVYLPAEFRSNDTSESAIGDLSAELRVFIAAGIDGLFCDQPDVPVRVRGPCV